MPSIAWAWRGWCLAALLLARGAQAGCVDELAQARLIGAGDFCVLGICLYDARLYASRAPVDLDAPFALELSYRRHFSRKQLVGAGMHELDRLAGGALTDEVRSAWQADMLRAFDDVGPGDSLCGVYLPSQGARFYRNGQPGAAVDDPVFAKAFFSIWLDPRTRAPALRRKLLGEAAP
ncbi:chalcone isomerase family protein [Burkholderia gladioli]|uniref:chalcone isomerase family protein n=1 Tax=Burkholderia gladioli TaxID=28095 RepID=UPI000F814D24|nr:chalcone isomerase family protein [Burkholderia gladioli]